MQAIQTRYKGPTDSKGSRVIVRAEAGRMIVPRDHALDIGDNHIAAAHKFAERYGWKGRTVSGVLPDGSWCHIIVRR